MCLICCLILIVLAESGGNSTQATYENAIMAILSIKSCPDFGGTTHSFLSSTMQTHSLKNATNRPTLSQSNAAKSRSYSTPLPQALPQEIETCICEHNCTTSFSFSTLAPNLSKYSSSEEVSSTPDFVYALSFGSRIIMH